MTKPRVTKSNGNGRPQAPETETTPKQSALEPPPHDPEIERRLLGCFVIDSAEALAVVGEFTDLGGSAEMFFDRRHQVLMKTIFEMSEQGEEIDNMTLTHRLREEGNTKKAGGVGYVAGLGDHTPSTENLPGYFKILESQFRLRKAIQAAAKIRAIASSAPREIDRAIEAIDEIWWKIAEPAKSKTMTAGEAGRAAMEIIEKIAVGKVDEGCISTGFFELDKLIHGFFPGQFYVIAARTSVGKTTLGTDLLTNISYVGTPCSSGDPVPVTFFTLEMKSPDLAEKMIGSVAAENFHLVRRTGGMSDEKLKRCWQVAAKLDESPIKFVRMDKPPVSEVVRYIRHHRRKFGTQVVFIDYLQLIRSPARCENRYQAVGEISMTLKALALELDISIVGMAQLNRKPDDRGGLPKLSDLRESGSIEQDADVVLLMYRTEEEQKRLDAVGEDSFKTEIVVAKNRRGPSGQFQLLRRKTAVNFESVAVTLPTGK